jgi:alcohol dehydrogenase
MSESVRAAVLHAPGDLRVENVEPGELTGRDLYIRVEACGVCGSDVGLLAGKIPASYPAIIGHEIAGVVDELGPGAAEHHGVQVGDRIVLEFPIRCDNCRYCRQGDYRLCLRAGGYGGPISMQQPPRLWGGMSERTYVSPLSNLHKVPDGMTPEIALLACAVLGNGIRWTTTLGGATIGSSVVVLGPGPQGLACVIAAREAGATQIVAVGRKTSEHRLALAQLYGATATCRSDVDDAVGEIRKALGEKGADVVVDTTGSTESLLLALPLSRKGGTVVAAGQSGAAHQPIPLDLAVEHEITVVGANSHDFRAALPALDLLASGRYDFEAMLTHLFPLDEAAKAVATMRDPDQHAVKVVIRP